MNLGSWPFWINCIHHNVKTRRYIYYGYYGLQTSFSTSTRAPSSSISMSKLQLMRAVIWETNFTFLFPFSIPHKLKMHISDEVVASKKLSIIANWFCTDSRPFMFVLGFHLNVKLIKLKSETVSSSSSPFPSAKASNTWFLKPGKYSCNQLSEYYNSLI